MEKRKIYEEMAILHHRMAQLFEKLIKPEETQEDEKHPVGLALEPAAQEQETCLHVSAGGTFDYQGEGLGATRECRVCGLEHECFQPDPVNSPQHVQWRKKLVKDLATDRPVTVSDSNIPAFGRTAKNGAKSNVDSAPASNNGNGSVPATVRQLWMLHIQTKKDTREWVISKQEASDLITALKSEDQATVTRILTNNQIAAAA